jgi:hypothetical protein
MRESKPNVSKLTHVVFQSLSSNCWAKRQFLNKSTRGFLTANNTTLATKRVISSRFYSTTKEDIRAKAAVGVS